MFLDLPIYAPVFVTDMELVSDTPRHKKVFYVTVFIIGVLCYCIHSTALLGCRLILFQAKSPPPPPATAITAPSLLLS